MISDEQLDKFIYPVKLRGDTGKRSDPSAPKDRYAWACNVIGTGKFIVNESTPSHNREDWVTTYWFVDEKDAIMFSLLWLE